MSARMMLRACGLLVAIGTCAAAAPVGHVGCADVLLDEAKGLAGVEATVGGVRFRPLAGAGAMGDDGKVDAAIRLDVDVKVVGDALRITIASSHTSARGIDPGNVQGLGEWRRIDLSRYAGPYGQVWWPKTTYSVKGDFWFAAHWVMEESNGTRWKATNQKNRGNGPFPAALQVHYAPDTRGRCLPIREVLELRFAKRLWDAAPPVRQGPSEYRDFLAKGVFIDLWGGSTAAELKHLLNVVKAVSRGRRSYYTILQNWEAAGWDALLPDSMWLPDYPPNPSVGTMQELRELCALGKTMGRFGFRTNYVLLRDCSPSYRRGLVRYAIDSAGKRRRWMRCADWLPTVRRAENEIRHQFAPTASFTDQMTSGAAPWVWHDYAADGGSRSMRQTMDHQKAVARLIKSVHQGPLSSESCMDQHLLGEFVDTGDFAIKNGHSRLFSPEYKLRRLHGLSGFHGMGLMYRFYEMPPFKSFRHGLRPYKNDPRMLDDYRCCEILFGNGGYLCHDFANWSYYLTECLLVGQLQKHYSAQPVREVRYQHEGRWVTLEQLVREGHVPNIIPWLPQTKAYGRVWVEYENGLTIVVNRLPEELAVPDADERGVVLPKSGWVAWQRDGSLLSFSAYWQGTKHRVDYLRDDRAGVQYLDPRGGEIMGVSAITLWENGKVVVTADPGRNMVTVEGRTLQLDLPKPAPLKTIDFGFSKGMEGWSAIRGILRADARDGCMRLDVVAPDPFVHSPALEVDADRIGAVEVRMRVRGEGIKSDGLFFTTQASPNLAPDKRVGFSVIADGEFHLYRIDVGSHGKWKGQTITGLRLDPVRATMDAAVEIDFIRGAPK